MAINEQKKAPRIISAGAGSGKTYRLATEMVQILKEGAVRANGIIATTFTRKAAAELQERVRVRLLEEGLSEQADQLANALIGTCFKQHAAKQDMIAHPAVDLVAEFTCHRHARNPRPDHADVEFTATHEGQ